jgi:ABC-type multidrug transport system fused ATPase/permease subunit
MLALARALAGDPEVLILDEAFSQIDPESEHMIMSRLPRIMANRTCIIIAHRLSTALHADRILVIRNGAIEEDGDHQSLLQANGCYAHMVRLASIGH